MALCVGLLWPAVADAAVISSPSSAREGLLPVLADLSVTKAGLPDPVHEDSDLTYQITVTNAGPDTAAGVSLADMVPSGTTFVSFSQTSGPAFTPTLPNVGGTGLVGATAATFAVRSATFRLIVHVTARDGTTITNTATVTSATADPNPNNNSATATNKVNKVQAAADLSITKCDAPDPVVPGENITYTIGAANAGPSEARNVTITDAIPANTTFASFTQDSGPAFTLTTPAPGETGTVTARRATFAAGASATFTLVVNANSDTPDGTIISNTVTISSDTGEKNPQDNSATAITHVEGSKADLSVTKSDSPDPVQAGSDITYTIVLTSAGPSDARNVVLSDAIPANTTFASFVQDTGPGFTLTTPAAGETGMVTATADTFASGASATFILVVNVNADTPAGTVISNTASVSSDTCDKNPDNDSATATTKVEASTAADLSVAKSDSPDPVQAGDNITYTIGAANAGPSEARNVTITDEIPANTTFVSFTQNSGPAFTLTTPAAGGTGTVTATADTFASGASATFTLVVNVNADTPDGTVISNTVTISSDTCDKNPDNNSATATTTVEASAAADLSVTKSDSPDPVTAGDNLTYTIVLTSAGPSDALNVALSDAIPANTTFVSWTQTAGPTFVLTAPPSGAATGAVTATADTFASGASATFTLIVNVNADTAGGTVISNTAAVSSSTRDQNTTNNSATETTGVARGGG